MQATPQPAVCDEYTILRRLVVGIGLGWSILFVVLALGYELQLYADGAMFSYAVAVQDVWAFHWHNISTRLSVFFLSLWPAEAYVGLTGDPHGGIAIYGFLFYVAPLAGLAGTFIVDRSRDRIMFVYACASTALLCPLVFGFPTEMWMAHALFWPTLASAHYARRCTLGTALVAIMMAALVFTHAGGVVLALVVVVTLGLHGLRHPLFLRGAIVLLAALAAWFIVKAIYPPDDYFADVLVRAALGFFDPAIFEVNLVLLLTGVLGGYALALVVLCRYMTGSAAVFAAVMVTAFGLLSYLLWLDQWIHASNRYYLRTLLVVVTPVFGLLSALYAERGDHAFSAPGLLRLTKAIGSGMALRTFAGAVVLVTIVHAAQTARFISNWGSYKTAVRALAMGSTADPELGDPRFVSSERIAPHLRQLTWFSTIEYLSVIVADFRPSRLVIDPAGNYFWLSCETATENAKAARAVPAPARDLVRIYSCLHR
jgi:hypothetical protein